MCHRQPDPGTPPPPFRTHRWPYSAALAARRSTQIFTSSMRVRCRGGCIGRLAQAPDVAGIIIVRSAERGMWSRVVCGGVPPTPRHGHCTAMVGSDDGQATPMVRTTAVTANPNPNAHILFAARSAGGLWWYCIRQQPAALPEEFVLVRSGFVLWFSCPQGWSVSYPMLTVACDAQCLRSGRRQK